MRIIPVCGVDSSLAGYVAAFPTLNNACWMLLVGRIILLPFSINTSNSHPGSMLSSGGQLEHIRHADWVVLITSRCRAKVSLSVASLLHRASYANAALWNSPYSRSESRAMDSKAVLITAASVALVAVAMRRRADDTGPSESHGAPTASNPCTTALRQQLLAVLGRGSKVLQALKVANGRLSLGDCALRLLGGVRCFRGPLSWARFGVELWVRSTTAVVAVEMV